jgi:hypothetical protein
MSISSAEIDVGRVLDRWNGAGSGDSSFIAKPMCLGDDLQLGHAIQRSFCEAVYAERNREVEPEYFEHVVRSQSQKAKTESKDACKS